MADEASNQSKKPYVAPQVRVISLRPEEAVLGSCKTPSQAGPVSTGCQGPGGVGSCHSFGS
jgi:hypothetical protein